MKNQKNKKTELGQELAAQRQAKGFSVEKLSDITKISVKNIQHLENGVFDFLPSAYVKAYLSSVAKELGLDSSVVLKKYHASFIKDVDASFIDESIGLKPQEKKEPVSEPSEFKNVPESEPQQKEMIESVEIPETESEVQSDKAKEVTPESEPVEIPEPALEENEPIVEEPEPVQDKEPETPVPVVMSEPEVTAHRSQPSMAALEKHSWFEDFKLMLGFYSVFIYGFLILAVIVTALIIFIPKLKTSGKVDTAVVAQDTSAMQIKSDSLEQIQETQPLSLRMIVTDTTWLRIVYSDSIADEAIFVPGDERTWESSSNFWMRIGNASGIQLFLDDKDLGAPGTAGRITNIKISENGIDIVKKEQFPVQMNIEGQ